MLAGLEIDLTEEVLDALDVPRDEEIREQCRARLNRAGHNVQNLDNQIGGRVQEALHWIVDRTRISTVKYN